MLFTTMLAHALFASAAAHAGEMRDLPITALKTGTTIQVKSSINLPAPDGEQYRSIYFRVGSARTEKNAQSFWDDVKENKTPFCKMSLEYSAREDKEIPRGSLDIETVIRDEEDRDLEAGDTVDNGVRLTTFFIGNSSQLRRITCVYHRKAPMTIGQFLETFGVNKIELTMKIAEADVNQDKVRRKQPSRSPAFPAEIKEELISARRSS